MLRIPTPKKLRNPYGNMFKNGIIYKNTATIFENLRTL